MPYVNMLSYWLLPLKIPAFINALEEEKHPIFPGIIEIYHTEWSPKTI
jgi:hypothetical protein